MRSTQAGEGGHGPMTAASRSRWPGVSAVTPCGRRPSEVAAAMALRSRHDRVPAGSARRPRSGADAALRDRRPAAPRASRPAGRSITHPAGTGPSVWSRPYFPGSRAASCTGRRAAPLAKPGGLPPGGSAHQAHGGPGTALRMTGRARRADARARPVLLPFGACHRGDVRGPRLRRRLSRRGRGPCSCWPWWWDFRACASAVHYPSDVLAGQAIAALTMAAGAGRAGGDAQQRRWL